MTIFPRDARASRFLAPLAAVGTAGVLALAPAAAAFADPPAGVPTAVYAGDGVGYNKVLNGYAAGTTLLKVEGGDTVEAFCIQYSAAVARQHTYTARTWGTSGVKGLGKAADIAVHHASLGTKLDNAQAENAAAQLAIWHFTDGTAYSGVPNASIVKRADELVAKAGTFAEPSSSFVLTSKSSVTGTGAQAKSTVVAHVATVTGTPLAGQSVTVTLGSATSAAKTNAAGDATVTLAAPSKDEQATVALATALPAGSVLAPDAGQAMIVTQGAKVSRTATVTVAAAPAPVPTPTVAVPTPTVSPQPIVTKPAPTATAQPTPVKTSKSAAPQQLPYTGSWVHVWMVLAAAAAAVGGFVVRRRLRSQR